MVLDLAGQPNSERSFKSPDRFARYTKETVFNILGILHLGQYLDHQLLFLHTHILHFTNTQRARETYVSTHMEPQSC